MQNWPVFPSSTFPSLSIVNRVEGEHVPRLQRPSRNPKISAKSEGNNRFVSESCTQPPRHPPWKGSTTSRRAATLSNVSHGCPTTFAVDVSQKRVPLEDVIKVARPESIVCAMGKRRLDSLDVLVTAV